MPHTKTVLLQVVSKRLTDSRTVDPYFNRVLLVFMLLNERMEIAEGGCFSSEALNVDGY